MPVLPAHRLLLRCPRVWCPAASSPVRNQTPDGPRHPPFARSGSWLSVTGGRLGIGVVTRATRPPPSARKGSPLMITAENTPNLPGWIDLGSPDPGASAEFYRRVFGWTAEQVQEESDQGPGYWYLRKDGKA